MLNQMMSDDVGIEHKTFSDCSYISCKALGLSMRLCPPSQDGVVDVVFLYNDGVAGFNAYQSSALPSGINWSHKSRDVVMLLGEPSDKTGGNRMPVQISYEVLGIEIHFKHNSCWKVRTGNKIGCFVTRGRGLGSPSLG